MIPVVIVQIKYTQLHQQFVQVYLFAKNILDFYELPSIFVLIENIPSKLVWKTHIKEKLEKHWKLQIFIIISGFIPL
jgi:hypothetical protein